MTILDTLPCSRYDVGMTDTDLFNRHSHHFAGTMLGCPHCVTEEVGCIDDHHGAACDHPTCTDCGTLLEDIDDTCPECGRVEAG